MKKEEVAVATITAFGSMKTVLVRATMFHPRLNITPRPLAKSVLSN
jgi:hypothetical protein